MQNLQTNLIINTIKFVKIILIKLFICHFFLLKLLVFRIFKKSLYFNKKLTKNKNIIAIYIIISLSLAK